MSEKRSHKKSEEAPSANAEATADPEASGSGEAILYDKTGAGEPHANPTHKPPLKLKWLVDDFRSTTDSVYEAGMVCAIRARQIGMRQKQEIDRWNAAHEITEASILAEEHTEKGVDHFHHTKPTVKAMDELKKRELTFSYPEGTAK